MSVNVNVRIHKDFSKYGIIIYSLPDSLNSKSSLIVFINFFIACLHSSKSFGT